MELTYTVLSRAWYGPAAIRNLIDPHVVDQVTFGATLPDGSGEWEASFEWRNLDNRMPPSAQLRVFDQAWRGAARSGVLNAIASLNGDTASPTVPQVCALLDALGFRDVTPEVRP